MIFQLKDGNRVIAETQNDLVRFDDTDHNVDVIGFDVDGTFNHISCEKGDAPVTPMTVRGEIWFRPFTLRFTK